ncbi:MAG TPA: methyltransferase domain-containing protein [Propionibacteriaceae bacterium]|nr:methyltransferase domain-containing protein [Propionibacteriaceae bacterium]
MSDDVASPSDFWEDRYASSERVWSGRVNDTVVQVVSGLAPGRALDLGCGEGGDVIWLAQHGWEATGVDISETATRRAAAAAREAGIPEERAQFVAADLATWVPTGTYDLVTASFLQSPVHLPREEILRRASQHVGRGGRLLVVAHAAMPPWADAHAHHHDDLPSPEQEVEAIGLDTWDVEVAEVRSREAIGPDGRQVVLDDSVVCLRRPDVPES